MDLRYKFVNSTNWGTGMLVLSLSVWSLVMQLLFYHLECCFNWDLGEKVFDVKANKLILRCHVYVLYPLHKGCGVLDCVSSLSGQWSEDSG